MRLWPTSQPPHHPLAPHVHLIKRETTIPGDVTEGNIDTYLPSATIAMIPGEKTHIERIVRYQFRFQNCLTEQGNGIPQNCDYLTKNNSSPFNSDVIYLQLAQDNINPGNIRN
eukprot:Tbor_TRINITY_DN5428_c0_g2::TRINITY_DN5428_c0_g2_i2::g.24079::m.24079